MERLVLLICILNPGETRDQARMMSPPFFRGETGRLKGIITDILYFYIIHVSIAGA